MNEDKEKSYQPLLDEGIHDIEVDECFDLFVRPFKNNEHRSKLMERFLHYYWELCQLGIFVEIWLDGSFVTKKEQPSDIDIVLIVNRSQLNELDHDQARTFYTLMQPIITKARYGIDVRMHGYDEHERKEQKRKLFSYDKNLNKKGFARLKIYRNIDLSVVRSDEVDL